MLGLHPHHVAALPVRCPVTARRLPTGPPFHKHWWQHYMRWYPGHGKWGGPMKKVMGNWTGRLKKSDLQAPRCLVTWEMAPSCCLHFHAAHLGQDLQSTAPFPGLFASTSVDVHERWWPVRFELLVTFCSQPFNILQLCGPAEPSWNQLCGWNVGHRWPI